MFKFISELTALLIYQSNSNFR